MANRLALQINNGEMLVLFQNEDDATIHVNRWNADGSAEHTTSITAPDFVMLINMYRYIKDNDIQNDFINPNGKNKEE